MDVTRAAPPVRAATVKPPRIAIQHTLEVQGGVLKAVGYPADPGVKPVLCPVAHSPRGASHAHAAPTARPAAQPTGDFWWPSRGTHTGVRALIQTGHPANKGRRQNIFQPRRVTKIEHQRVAVTVHNQKSGKLPDSCTRRMPSLLYQRPLALTESVSDNSYQIRSINGLSSKLQTLAK
jgi:hypothetical protein